MNEQEMMYEIERLRRELAVEREERKNLHKVLCSMIPVDRTEISTEEFEEHRNNARPVDEWLRDLLPPDMHHLIGQNESIGH